MPAPISVVIPTLDAAGALPETLRSLMEGLEAGIIRDLVISDGGSTDATRAIAEAAGATVVDGPPGRGGQLARGVAAASGEWLLLLHADTHLSPGWTDAVRTHIHAHPGAGGYFQLVFRARGIAPRLVAAWANLRSRLFGLPYGDQGIVLARCVLEEVGGVPDFPLMEDVALARALRGRLRMLPAVARTSAARYLSEGWLRRGAHNLMTLLRYISGADPARLARHYRPRE